MMGGVNSVRLGSTRAQVNRVAKVSGGDGNSVEAQPRFGVKKPRLVEWLKSADAVGVIVLKPLCLDQLAVSVKLAQRLGSRSLKMAFIKCPIRSKYPVLVSSTVGNQSFGWISSAPPRAEDTVSRPEKEERQPYEQGDDEHQCFDGVAHVVRIGRPNQLGHVRVGSCSWLRRLRPLVHSTVRVEVSILSYCFNQFLMSRDRKLLRVKTLVERIEWSALLCPMRRPGLRWSRTLSGAANRTALRSSRPAERLPARSAGRLRDLCRAKSADQQAAAARQGRRRTAP